MPFAKCPHCGTITHLSVRDVDKWYAELAPGKKVGDLVDLICFSCWSAREKAASEKTPGETTGDDPPIHRES